MTSHEATAFTGDKTNPAAVAAHLHKGGLRDPEVLTGPRGLRFFSDHGLTESNQAAVMERLKVLVQEAA
ncbi:MAG: hypothetical protein LC623_05430 [Halobacteriales archaeon]|nr:hypothetical protein [Halobacteriales archaeon]